MLSWRSGSGSSPGSRTRMTATWRVSAPASDLARRRQVRRRETLGHAAQESVEGLTPHHRLHGDRTYRIRVETLAGRWGEVRALSSLGRAGSRGERGDALCWHGTVVPHSSRPPARTAATTSEHAGSRRGLTPSASKGGSGSSNRRRVRLALARHDLAELPATRRFPESRELRALGLRWRLRRFRRARRARRSRADRGRAHRNGCGTGTYVEPFALRALGVGPRRQPLLSEAAAVSRRWVSTGTRARRGSSSCRAERSPHVTVCKP